MTCFRTVVRRAEEAYFEVSSGILRIYEKTFGTRVADARPDMLS